MLSTSRGVPPSLSHLLALSHCFPASLALSRSSPPPRPLATCVAGDGDRGMNRDMGKRSGEAENCEKEKGEDNDDADEVGKCWRRNGHCE
eukprot:5136683-Pyramimonas_sp.AAC.1